MLPKDDTQHQAELRQAFLKHLPRRIDMVRKRAQRLAGGAWDINLLGVLCQEAQVLTGATGRYGLIEASERLYQLELLLTDLLCDAAVPEPATKLRLTDLANQLIAAGEAPRADPALASDFVVAPAASTLPFPLSLTPPAEFWRRFSTREVELLSVSHPLGSATPPAAAFQVQPQQRENRFDSFSNEPQPLPMAASGSSVTPGYHDPFADALTLEAAPSSSVQLLTPAAMQPSSSAPEISYDSDIESSRLSAEAAAASAAVPSFSDAYSAPAPAPAAPRTNRAYVLAEPGPFAREVTARLVGHGLSVERIDNIEELKETMSAQPPDLVVLEALFAAELEHLGEFIRRLRARITTRIVLCAVLPGNDLPMRLKAMRAGIDLTLPMPVTAVEVAQRAQELVAGEPAAHYRILIVEDDRSQALFAESVLRKAGMETRAVTDPLETISALEQFRPDLILMDLYMPGIDGMELTAIIREREDFISTPIVFLSGEQDSEKHFEALSAGGDDFLGKPIRPKHLISAVTNRARRAHVLKQRKVASSPRDAESGLFERAFVLDKLGALFGQDELSTSVAFVELDSAARLREQHGVAGLDALIVQLSASLVGSLRESEYATRYGDASLLVLTPSRAPTALAELAVQWRSQISAARYELEGKSVPLQVSIGIAQLTPGMADPAMLINAAERAMLQARAPSSREKVRIYAPEKQRNEEDHLLDMLGRALKLEDFQLLFEPIVALGSTGQEQYEVLLRLRTDDGKLLSAAQFMPVALKHNLAAEVDRFLLSRSLSIIDERRRQGRSLRMFVGQSAASLLDTQRASWLKQMLDTRKLPPDQLTLLFNFNELLPQLRAAMPFFQAMRVAGIRLGLDGFESNLTALQLLGYLPVDYLRLAHKYVGAQGLNGAEELRALVTAAHDGGRQVIATRVENAQTAASLWSLAVDLIQGNFVQQPGAELGFDFNHSAL